MKKNGFTLVELLAVIVILAIIMIIAIPSVLSTMQTAKSKSFLEFAQKVATQAQKVYVEDTTIKGFPSGDAYAYNIKTDLELNSTGQFEGYAFVYPNNDDMKKITVMIWDESYLYQGPSSEISADNLKTRKDFDVMMSFANFDGVPLNNIDELDYEKIRALMVHDLQLHDKAYGRVPSDYSNYTFINGSDGSVIPATVTTTYAEDVENQYLLALIEQLKKEGLL